MSKAREPRLVNYCVRHAQTLLGTLGRLSRQPLSSLMTVAVIGIALALPAGLHLLVINGQALGGRWDTATDIAVYLRHEVSVADARELASRIDAREDVAEVEVIPADAALAEFRSASGFGEALDALEDNPLPSTLVVRPVRGRDLPEDIENLSDDLREMPETDIVQGDIEWVRRLHAILDIVRRGVTLAGGMLALAVIIIVGNTIRLDIQNRRDEIVVTKLIGASNGFIRRPFLYTGAWYGLAGGLVAVLVVQGGLALLQGPVQRVAGLYGSSYGLHGLEPVAALALVGGSTFLGWLGSWIAAARHMRAIEPR